VLPETAFATLPEALDKLAALGDRHHIATYFVERDLKGACNSPTHCPVSRYLSEETGVEFGVGEEAAHLWEGDVSIKYEKLPAPVSDFVRHFDAHEYPELEMHLLDILRIGLAPRSAECG
jgi:hypothetical protein